MVLVDTSCWIEALRERGREDVRQRVAELLLDGEAAWCEIVRMELLQGVRAGREAKELRKLEESEHGCQSVDDRW
ncbi:MAG TPA: PIN domain-containing protein [Tepidisphaeraceae bacterium]|nr:PIN domain-containing protein [Tepidisphaeraceae bacterium]